tara:strand:- start:140 stop:265 length:126 start_codon:yes stop_codon:yes gene_type:complete
MNSPEPIKNGEGGLLSETKWTLVEQHAASGLDFGVIPLNTF